MGIYNTVPLEVIGRKGDRFALRVLLEENKGKFFTARKLAKLCRYSGKSTQVDVRKAITELIEIYGCPIVSSEKGFCWAVSGQMIDDYLLTLKSRVEGINRRIRALDGARRNL